MSLFLVIIKYFSNIGAAESQEGDDVPGTNFSRQAVNNESVRSASIPATSKLEPQLHDSKTHVRTTKIPDFDRRGELQPPSIPSTARERSSSAVDEAGPHREAQRHYSTTFTAKKISSSISSSEDTRILSSMAIALLVILSHLRIPLLSSNIITTVVAAMPVYLVLLTDVTIVIARLLREKQVIPKKMVDRTQVAESKDVHGWAEGLGANLETGLVVYKAITAAIMDCSVYIVVVICGLSLVQGWI